MFGGPAALAKAVTGDTPKHLLRSSYLPLAGQKFRIGGKSLQLGVVDDLAGAAGDKHLRGHPEAFALTFYGPPNAFAAMVQTFTHPDLGTYSLFVAAVGEAEGQVQHYEVVVDRSVGVPKRPPGPSKDATPPPERPGSDEDAAEKLAEFEADVAAQSRQLNSRAAKRKRVKRRRKLKRRRAKKKATLARRRKAVQRPARHYRS
jgi:hypothetical protein